MPQISKKCCVNCFNPETLKKYIMQNGAKGKCSYCESEDVFCIDPELLQDLFWPVINLYDTVENFMPLEDLKSDNYSDSIWDKLNMDWELFPYYGDDFDQYTVEQELLGDIFPEDPHHGPNYQFLHSYVEDEDEYWGIRKSWVVLVERWDKFCKEIKNNNRFFPKQILDLNIVRKLLRYLDETLDKEIIVYRARISHDGTRIVPSKMGKPSKKRSESGRANPKGIPYLYISSSPKTAIAEVRPVIMDRVTVGTFKITKKIKVVDLRKKVIGDPFRYGDRISEVVDYLLFIHQLGSELSKTINPRESNTEYLPTQYLAEYIKGIGYDGIIYGSSLVTNESEFNVVIFNDDKLKCVSTTLHEVYEILHKNRKIRS